MFWKIRSNLEKNLEFDLYNSSLWKWIRNSSTILISIIQIPINKISIKWIK